MMLQAFEVLSDRVIKVAQRYPKHAVSWVFGNLSISDNCLLHLSSNTVKLAVKLSSHGIIENLANC